MQLSLNVRLGLKLWQNWPQVFLVVYVGSLYKNQNRIIRTNSSKVWFMKLPGWAQEVQPSGVATARVTTCLKGSLMYLMILVRALESAWRWALM